LKRPAVLLYLDRKNWYSLVPLVNSLDESPVGAEIIPSTSILQGLREACRRYEPVICCISFFTTQLPRVIEQIAQIRSEFGEKVTLVAGGPHATGSPRETVKMGFDVVVKGEGELVLPGLVRDLIAPASGSRHTGKVVEGIPLSDLDSFSPVSIKRGLLPPIEITRGCLFRCKFCSVPCVLGRVRHRSIESVVETGRRLVRLVSRWDFRFISSNSLGYGSYSRKPNERAVQCLLESLRRLEGHKRIYFSSFPSEARPDFVTERMVELISGLTDNRTVCIGAQSGSDRVLKEVRRGHDLEAVYRASGLILDGGLRPVIDFILGFPCERESDQLQTLDVMHDLVKMGGKVRVHHFMPLAGSAMSGMMPSRIAPEVLGEIGRMALGGSALGAFNEQMKLAGQIASHRAGTGISRSRGVVNR